MSRYCDPHCDIISDFKRAIYNADVVKRKVYVYLLELLAIQKRVPSPNVG